MTNRLGLYQSQFDIPAHTLSAETKNQSRLFSTEPDRMPTPATLLVAAAVAVTTGVGFVSPPVAKATPLVASESPQLTGKPFPASQQQVEAFAPQGAIFSITPQGWASESPVVLGKAFNASQQQFTSSFSPRGSFVFTNWGWSSESPVALGKAYNVALQQFTSPYPPQGNVPTAPTFVAATSHSVQVNRKVLYQSAANVVQPFARAFTQWGWSSESPQLRAPSFNCALQPVTSAFAPKGSFAFTNWGWASESPYLLTAKFNASQQQSQAFAPRGTFQFTNWGWSSESPILLGKAYKSTLQQDIAAAVQQVPTAATPHGWQPVIYEPYVPPLKAALQQFVSILPFPSVTTTFAPAAAASSYTLTVNRKVLYQAAANVVQPITRAQFTNWGWSSESPVLLGKLFNAVLQQDIAEAIQQVPTAATPHGWQPVIYEPRIPQFNAALQQYSILTPFPTTTITFAPAVGASSYTLTVNRKVLYQSAANVVQPITFAQFTNWGWSSESPYLLVPKFNTAQQQFGSSFAPQGSFQFINWGWASESPQFHISPYYSVSLQQAVAAAVRQVPTASTPEGWQPVTFDPVIRGYNVALQQFSGMLPFPYTTVIPTIKPIPHNLPWFATMGKMKSF